MYYKSITRMVKLSLSIVVMVFAQAYAAEERTGEGLLPEQNFSHSSENLIGIPSSRGGELRRLLLEHDLSVAVGDNGPYPYTHPTYRLIFEKEGEMGAVHIVLSNHAFPFPCLPDGEQMVILRCDSLKHELSSKEMRNTPGELGLSREILQQLFSRNSYSWFSKLDIEAQNRLKMDHELLHFLKTNFDFDDQENPFDHFHASLLRNYLMDRFYIRVRSMDFAATEHYEEWSGFEPVNVHEIDVLFDIKLDSDEFSTFFNYSEAQLQSMCLDLTPPEDDEELLDFALKLRNPYWLDYTFTQGLQPNKLGLYMFGFLHAERPYGIMTKVRKVLAKTNRFMSRVSPAKKLFWKGVHFVRLEQLEGRTWLDVSPHE